MCGLTDVASALHTARLEDSQLSLPALDPRTLSWGMALGGGAGLCSEAYEDTLMSIPQSLQHANPDASKHPARSEMLRLDWHPLLLCHTLPVPYVGWLV